MRSRPDTLGARVPAALTGHLPGLDGVRGLAILMVMMLHFVGSSACPTKAQRLVVKLANFGGLGVDLFFVLSGFLITGLLLDAKAHSGHYFANFYARRTLRIFPLYYLALTLFLLVLPQFVTLPPGLELSRSHQAWLWTYTANFYIASQASWMAVPYFTHFWSLAVEEHFYLFWPVIVFLASRRTLERICAALIVAALGLRLALAASGASDIAMYILTPCRLDALCVGGLLAALARREGGAERLVRESGRALLLAAGAIAALSPFCDATRVGVMSELNQVRGTVYALFFGALMLTSLKPAASPWGAAFQSAPLRFFGKYSYGLYVYHGMLKPYLDDIKAEPRLDAFFGNHWWTILARAALGVGVSIGLAILSYELFEKRILSLKRFFER